MNEMAYVSPLISLLNRHPGLKKTNKQTEIKQNKTIKKLFPFSYHD